MAKNILIYLVRAPVAASSIFEDSDAAVYEEVLDPIRTGDPIPAHGDASVVEVRGTPRLSERPPAPEPSVSAQVAALVSSSETMANVVSTGRVDASSLDKEVSDRPSGLKRRASRSLLRSDRHSCLYKDESCSDNEISGSSRRRSFIRMERSGLRRRKAM